jgi:hypothetical protein
MKVEIVGRVEVYLNPGRDLHGPCVVRTGNGDLLLCHQGSEEHGRQDGFAHQWRSEDNGFTWQDEGPVADWRDRGGARVCYDCLQHRCRFLTRETRIAANVAYVATPLGVTKNSQMPNVASSPVGFVSSRAGPFWVFWILRMKRSGVASLPVR